MKKRSNGGPSQRDQQILALYAEGTPITRLAEQFGVSRQRIDQILKRYGGVDAATARGLRARQREDEFNRSVEDFLNAYRGNIVALGEGGSTRSEAEQRFLLLAPDISLAVIQLGIAKSGVLFDVAREDFHFPPSVIEAAVWYVFARIHDLHGTLDIAIEELTVEEMTALQATLVSDGVSPTALSQILYRIAAARAHITTHPEATIAAKEYDAERTAAVTELGLASGKGAFPWPPTSQTVRKRLGGGYWSDALRGIGITPSTKGRARGLTVFEETDYRDAVADFLSHCSQTGSIASLESFENWVRSEDRLGRRRPSGPSLRLFYGSWIGAKRQVIDEVSVIASRPPSTTVPASVARRALHDASGMRRQVVADLRAAPGREISGMLSQFVRDYVGDFEIRRREWLRSMILRDPSALDRRKALGQLPKQLRGISSDNPAELSKGLTDRYLDSMLVNGPNNTDGWLDAETQEQLDAMDDHSLKASKVLRELRNYLTHDSAESRERLRLALETLGGQDPRFRTDQPITRRVLTGWLTSNGAARLDTLASSFIAAWRAMLAAEAVQPVAE